jgi:hypothetical protein
MVNETWLRARDTGQHQEDDRQQRANNLQISGRLGVGHRGGYERTGCCGRFVEMLF